MDQSREPTLTFHDDADHVRSVLDQIDGPIVLVGNSTGGSHHRGVGGASKRGPPRLPGGVHA